MARKTNATTTAPKANNAKSSTTKQTAAPRTEEKKLNAAEQRVKDYLDDYARNDKQFAKKYQQSGKTIKGCFSYILKEARKMGSQVFCDDQEVFNWAIHYFDEDSISESATVADAPKAEVATAPDTVSSPKPRNNKPARQKPAAPKQSVPADDPFNFDLF